MLIHLFVAALSALLLPRSASAADTACSGPGYIVAMEADEIAVSARKGHVLFTQPVIRVYEGKGWSKMSGTMWNCIEDAKAALPKTLPARTGLPAYAVFAPSTIMRTPKSDKVPPNCTKTAYVVGQYTVTNPEQYAKYSKALSASGIASSVGMVIPFGGNKPVATAGGTWPENATLNLTVWPCIEAFEVFLLGDAYKTNIGPLRKDAAIYNLSRFEVRGEAK